MLHKKVFVILVSLVSMLPMSAQKGWTADNGNGTYTNPLFFEDTPDPCMIRVDSDYYLVCSSMHMMPGLPIMHSKDLVNWELINYAFDRINPGPEYSFHNTNHGSDAYGNGIWAPSFVYHKGTYYIFANVNNHTTQVFTSTDPYGHWKHYEMKKSFHDLSVFFDDDNKAYVCWGYKDVQLAQLNDELTDIIPGTQKTITHEGGEGSHMYKIKGKYYIIWSVPGANTPMLAGVATDIYGPYRIEAICDHNNMGVHALPGLRTDPRKGQPFSFWGDDPNSDVTLHQGGIIDTPTGEWWGYAMQDHTSLGRNTSLSPVTWVDDIPYFGLKGNLAQTPKVWVKPNVGLPQQPIRSLVNRDDDFSKTTLGLQWEWNHLPNDSAWSLKECPGKLRLHTLPAPNFWKARNTLAQRIVGLEADASVELDLNGLKQGDVSGFGLLIYPYAWIGVEKTASAKWLKMFNQMNYPSSAAMDSFALNKNVKRVWFRVHTNVDNGKANFAYSLDGKNYKEYGNTLPLHFQLYTFQGARYSLFSYNKSGHKGGYADFDNFTVDEKYPRGFSRPIPYGKTIQLVSRSSKDALKIDGCSDWQVQQLPLGRVALKSADGSYRSVDETNNDIIKLVKHPWISDSETFQWMELEGGDIVLMSLKSDRYLAYMGENDAYANFISPIPNRDKDLTRFTIK